MQYITTSDFWKSFWSNIALPISVNEKFQNDRVIAEYILERVPTGSNDMFALEIGCAPGKWLAFFERRLKYPVKGVEYVLEAANATKANLIAQGCPTERFEVIVGDFFEPEMKAKIYKKAHVVASFGFIEHFDDVTEVIKRQLEFLHHEGILVVGIPNFNGITGLIMNLLDSFISEPLLPKHNLRCMSPAFLSETLKSCGLTEIDSRKVGRFEPAMFPLEQLSSPSVRLFFKVLIYTVRVCSYLFGSKTTSSYIMASGKWLKSV